MMCSVKHEALPAEADETQTVDVPPATLDVTR